MAAPELAQVIERALCAKEPVTRDRVTGSSSWLASQPAGLETQIIGLSHAMPQRAEQDDRRTHHRMSRYFS
jgi:hypothetical protein